VTYVYDDVTYVYDDVTYVYDDVTYVFTEGVQINNTLSLYMCLYVICIHH